jgi:hypothetical protein
LMSKYKNGGFQLEFKVDASQTAGGNAGGWGRTDVVLEPSAFP